MIDKTQTITRAEGTWVVRVAGAVIGESDAALVLHEDGYEDVVFFPEGDIEMAFLDSAGSGAARPGHGEAQNYTVVAKSGPIERAAWSLASPEGDLGRLAGHIAFVSGEKVTVERV